MILALITLAALVVLLVRWLPAGLGPMRAADNAAEGERT